MLHLNPEFVVQIIALADACRRSWPTCPSARNPDLIALTAAVHNMSEQGRAELVALMWLGADLNGDGRDPIGWPTLVAGARQVSMGAVRDAAFVACNHAVLGKYLRAGLEAREVVESN